ncbi:hypothetical protein BDW68DRAFT_180260 [Aspergillus falconensis]
MDSQSQADNELISTFFASPNDPYTSKGQRLLQAHYAQVRCVMQNSQFRILMESQACQASLGRRIRQLRARTLTQITDDLLRSMPEPNAEAATCLLTFIIRVWLMCWIGSLPGEPSQGQTCIRWTEDCKFSEILAAHFKAQAQARPRESVQLGASLKACNLERFGRIRVIWTSNLPDHLRLYDPADDDEPYTLLVFHHAAFLETHRNSSIFPPGLVDETTQSLALLFPKYDTATIKWFKAQAQAMEGSLDPQALGYAPLEPSQRTTASFNYWAERLAMLNSAYEASEPRTLGQWWVDRRSPVQWATFWIAALVLVLTVFFGLVQSIEGALQVYKAYRPS